MTVFKTCMAILRKNWITMCIYFGIFTFMSVMFSQSTQVTEGGVADLQEVKVTVINEDDSEYAKSLETYINENMKPVEIVESEEGISDALFYRYTEYILIIPEGFGKAMEEGTEPKLEKYEVADSYSGIFMDNMINEYVAKMKIYGTEVPKDVETSMSYMEVQPESGNELIFNFSAYSLILIIVIGVSTVLGAFNEKEIKKRNLVSPVSDTKLYIQQVKSVFVFTVIAWFLTCVVSAVVIGPSEIGTKEILMCVNMFVYSMVCLAFGFFISTIVKSSNGRTILANVFGLGFCFIGGVMVPTSMLSDTVRKIGSFTPAYWFTNINETLVKMKEFSLDNMGGIFKSTGILVLFVVVFITLGLASSRKRAQ